MRSTYNTGKEFINDYPFLIRLEKLPPYTEDEKAIITAMAGTGYTIEHMHNERYTSFAGGNRWENKITISFTKHNTLCDPYRNPGGKLVYQRDYRDIYWLAIFRNNETQPFCAYTSGPMSFEPARKCFYFKDEIDALVFKMKYC